MSAPTMIRGTYKTSAELEEHVERLAALIEEEKPDLIRRFHLINKAAEEPGFSGDLRRAIHANQRSIDWITERTGIDAFHICDFLEGTAELTSAEIDKTANVLGLTLSFAIPREPKQSPRGGDLGQRTREDATAPSPSCVLSPEQRAEYERLAALVDAEKPDILRRLKLRDAAAAEPGFAGDLRRAIDASGIHVDYLAKNTGIDVFHILDFLAGTAELTSGEIDKLAKELGLTLTFAIPSLQKQPPRRAQVVQPVPENARLATAAPG